MANGLAPAIYMRMGRPGTENGRPTLRLVLSNKYLGGCPPSEQIETLILGKAWSHCGEFPFYYYLTDAVGGAELMIWAAFWETAGWCRQACLV